MMRTTTGLEAGFERELEIFRTEEETAQQYFFCYLSVRSLAASNSDVLKMMNMNPLFWVTTHHAMLLSAFMALGRIFDQTSKHNIDTLISMTSRALPAFTKPTLKARKQAAGLTPQQAAAYVADSHELTAHDIRNLRKEIVTWRRVYDGHYREIRHKVFAHKALSDIDEVNALLANTKVDELKDLFAFLSAIYSCLWETFHNGRRPTIHVRPFVLPPEQPAFGDRSPRETVYREGHAVLTSMLTGLVGSHH
jgi:hypothetical protein